MRLARTTSKAPRRNGRPPSARTTARSARVQPRVEPGGVDSLGVEVDADRAGAHRGVRAATARIPVPVPTSSTRPRGALVRERLEGAAGRGASSRGCRCRRPGPDRRRSRRRCPSRARPRRARSGSDRRRRPGSSRGSGPPSPRRAPSTASTRRRRQAREGPRQVRPGQTPRRSRRAARAVLRPPAPDLDARSSPRSQRRAIATSSSSAGTHPEGGHVDAEWPCAEASAGRPARSAEDVLHPVEERLVLVLQARARAASCASCSQELALLGAELARAPPRARATWRSPRPLRAEVRARPGRARGRSSPVCVPSGTVTFVLPAVEGGHLDRRARGPPGRTLIGISQKRLVPSRLKNGVLLDADHDVEVARGARRAVPASPSPRDAELAARVDAGRDLDLELALDRRSAPRPRQFLHGLATMRPVPRQRPQVRATLKKPCWKVTWPAPPQAGQAVGCGARRAPRCRRRSAQVSARGIWMWVSVPKAASSKRELEVVAQVGAPARAAARGGRTTSPKPKKSPRMSPKSAKIVGSKPRRLAAPTPGVAVGVVALALVRSRRARCRPRRASLKRSSASLSPGLRSGWYLRASFR